MQKIYCRDRRKRDKRRGSRNASGFGFWPAEGNGEQIPIGARGLEELAEITDDNVIPELAECKFKIACDVTNVLCGETGASAVYGPQKGADEEMTRKVRSSSLFLCVFGEEKDSESRFYVSGYGGGRRFGICISYIYGCTVGIRYPDCNKRNRLGAGNCKG